MVQEDKQLQSASTANPVLVVGVFRSGTSLLYALLNQHRDIALMYECNVWDFPEIFTKMRFRGDWLGRIEFFNRSLSRHRLTLGNRLHGLENVRTPAELYKTYGETKDARLYGEKAPNYCTRLRHLAKNHPGCSFILIWRDPVEIHRSVRDAALKSRFFGQRGMFSRMIFYQEQMIRQANGLTQSGNRVHHVNYQDLIDRTEESCRAICGFLGVEYDPKMIDLAGADLSAVFRAPQHEYLRRGKIERRQLAGDLPEQQTVQKLERFRSRWDRLRRQLFNHQTDSPGSPEPSWPELFFHNTAGRLLCAMDSGKRAIFEFLPFSWLITYRQTKEWFLNKKLASNASRHSMLDELLGNKSTFLISFLILAGVVFADHLTSFAVTLLPFYMVPSSILALLVGRRWGTFMVLISTMFWAFVQIDDKGNNPFANFSNLGLLLWDSTMRFLALEVVVLLLARIRIEINRTEASVE